MFYHYYHHSLLNLLFIGQMHCIDSILPLVNPKIRLQTLVPLLRGPSLLLRFDTSVIFDLDVSEDGFESDR